MKKTKDGTSIMDITTRVVQMLSPLDPENRSRVIQASLTLLGDTFVGQGEGSQQISNGGSGESGAFPPKADAWIRRQSITKDQLDQVFDISDGGAVTVIAQDVPGKNIKEKTINTYVLHGISCLLATGEPNFDDKSARGLCETVGCYNSANHAVYMKARGTSLTGSKDKGWKLTAPGLKIGADLVKDLAKGK